MKIRDRTAYIIPVLLIAFILAMFFGATCKGQIPDDKQKHLAAGALVGCVSTVVTLNKPELEAFAWVLGATALVGAGKELYDYNKNGNFSTPDLAYTIAGGLASYTVMRVIPNLFFKTYKRDKKVFISVEFKIPICRI